MRALYLALILMLTAPVLAAQEVADPAPQAVIRDQITAFQADDFPKAFTYASPMIQGMFGNAGNFGMMVQRGYPMVWRPAAVQFGKQRVEGSTVFQEVIIRDQQGKFHALEYELIPAGEGYLINGVFLLPSPALGA